MQHTSKCCVFISFYRKVFMCRSDVSHLVSSLFPASHIEQV